VLYADVRRNLSREGMDLDRGREAKNPGTAAFSHFEGLLCALFDRVTLISVVRCLYGHVCCESHPADDRAKHDASDRP